jgi:cytochrome c oxidase subunit 2
MVANGRAHERRRLVGRVSPFPLANGLLGTFFAMAAGGLNQSMLSPGGVQAWSIQHLWSLMLWTSTAVFVLVLLALGLALLRGRQNHGRADDALPSDRALRRAVTSAVALTAAVLLGLLSASVWTGRAVGALHASSAVSIAVTGHQWWWEIQYEDAVPSQRVTTGDEFHIPVGLPVVLKVTSRDVIHSLWIPGLQGKRDLIPGYTTAIWIQADEPGVFRGQCAEFCGMQHAHMALTVVAEPEPAFRRWLTAMRQPASEPSAAGIRRGRDVFMQARCAGCHTIRGTEAAGQVAPDLTHIGSRQTLGAATVPNTEEQLASWIRDPQHLKPGNQMPPNPLADADLRALVAYLGTLK